jgi:hypothetical protein
MLNVDLKTYLRWDIFTQMIHQKVSSACGVLQSLRDILEILRRLPKHFMENGFAVEMLLRSSLMEQSKLLIEQRIFSSFHKENTSPQKS